MKGLVHQIGLNTSDATAAAGDLLSGKTAYVDGNKITGTITGKGSQTYTPGTADQTITSGQFLSGTQTIAGDADLVSANIRAGSNIFGVAGDANVVNTSTGTAVAGDILSGKIAWVDGASVTGTIASKGAATFTPSTVNQTIAAGQYLSGIQTISGSANLTAANIKNGVAIFGVTGTFSYTASAATAAQILSGRVAFANGAQVTGTIASKGAATFTPGTTNQTIAAGQYLSGIQTISGAATLLAANIKSGITIFGVAGTAPAVTISQGSKGSSLNSPNTWTVTLGWKPDLVVATGYNSGGSYSYAMRADAYDPYATAPGLSSQNASGSMVGVYSISSTGFTVQAYYPVDNVYWRAVKFS